MSRLVEALRELVVLKREDHRHADAATLESALEILEQGPLCCDGADAIWAGWSRAKQRDGRPVSACASDVFERVCADCGYTVRRCEAHGGRKSVSRTMRLHRDANHEARSER